MPNEVTDDQILAAIEEAIEAGETDITGGAPPPAVAARVPLQSTTVSKRLSELAAEGEIEQVWGWPNPGASARRSYRIGPDKD